jgi:hypothetical protein
VQDRFEQHNRRLTGLLFAGGLTLALWRSSTWAGIRRLILMQAALGAAGKTPPTDRVKVVLEREAGYFEQFGTAAFAGHVAEQSGEKLKRSAPRSVVQVEQRANLYEGMARGLFYELYEERAVSGHGWVVRYEARDDVNTCKPCRKAAGYYLSGRGPMPGSVCSGQGKCRCKRRPVFDVAIYERLMREAG